MKVIGIVCSNRKGGNTEILVREALSGARESGADTDLLRISEVEITPCDGCMICHQSGECKIKDDMQEVYEKLLTAEGIILGSPVYFWSVSGQAKTLMDRTYALRYPHHKLKGKVCGAVVATGRRGSVNALSAINNFFLGHDMVVTGLGISGYGTNKGEVMQDKRAMGGARSLGRQIVHLIRVVHNPLLNE
ncbi:MAG: flavodoxin family protein [Promethearchaeota archaeon]